MHRKQYKQTKTKKQASKKQTNKNKAMRTLKTCGPKNRLPSTAAYKPWAFVRGFGWAYKRRGLYPGGLISGGEGL